MAVSNLTVGTASTGNNASVTPGAPTGLLPGDLMLIFATIRATAATVNTPAGWTRLSLNSNDNAQVFGRYFVTGDAMPLITFAGGVANADTYARCLKVRDAGQDALTETVVVQQANTSAQSTAYPALDVPGPNHLAVMLLWKQDDASSITTPAGWTAQGLTNMTAGDDAYSAIFTQLQTTEADIAAGTVAVFGGAPAVSASLMLAIKPAPVVTVTELNTFPPSTQITVNGLTPDDDVEIFRLANGRRIPVRAGYLQNATDPAFLITDAEIPFGVPVGYEVVVNATGSYFTATDTYVLVGGKVLLSDAISGNTSEFVITAWDEKQYEPQASVFKVGGRNIVVSGDMGMFESSIEVFFESYSSTENFLDVLANATEGVLQLRRPVAGYDGVDCYIAVTSARERRWSQDGSDGRRLWSLQVAEVEPWSDGQVAKGFTLQDLADAYVGQTLADLAADFGTLLELGQADLS